MQDDRFNDYKVGYKNPPMHTRFLKGQSGNPKGRPKGTNNFKTDLEQELAETIVVREGSKQIKVSKQRALLRRLTDEGVQGNPRMMAVLLNAIARFLGSSEVTEDEAIPSVDEREVYALLEQRILSRAQAAKREPKPE